jgi:hypothetical protein
LLASKASLTKPNYKEALRKFMVIKNLKTKALLWIWASWLVMLISGCGDSSQPVPPPTMAQASNIFESGGQSGVTPFIRFVQFQGTSFDKLASAHFVITPKPGSASKPVDVRYSLAALARRGYANPGSNSLTVPVFGLYAGYQNHLSIEFQFTDESKQALEFDITTPAYADPNAVYDRPTILKKRLAGSDLGFDFFAMKSAYGTPVVVDSDGEIRWVGAEITNSLSSTFLNNGFIVGTPGSTQFSRLEFDGSIQKEALAASNYTNFHHNLDPGKYYLLGNMDAVSSGVANVESIAIEFDSAGRTLKEWDFAALLSDYMLSQGDDPTSFIRPGIDWFHMNSATYDPRDDSLIVSSRENFVIKVDYSSGRLIWILGDPSKYWYTFASLRAKAVRLPPGALYPIGQHATSITSDGLLMLFNDGAPSFNQPIGAPVGESRNYSAVSAYDIDPVSLTAQEVWRFDYGQTVLSQICSSAYEAANKSLLVNYAFVNGGTLARLVGLNASRQVVFDFQYPNTGCSTSWNAIPIPLGSMRFE